MSPRSSLRDHHLSSLSSNVLFTRSICSLSLASPELTRRRGSVRPPSLCVDSPDNPIKFIKLSLRVPSSASKWHATTYICRCKSGLANTVLSGEPPAVPGGLAPKGPAVGAGACCALTCECHLEHLSSSTKFSQLLEIVISKGPCYWLDPHHTR